MDIFKVLVIKGKFGTMYELEIVAKTLKNASEIAFEYFEGYQPQIKAVFEIQPSTPELKLALLHGKYQNEVISSKFLGSEYI